MAVSLRPLAAEHLDDVSALFDDPDVLRFTRLPVPPPPGYARTWLERYEAGRLEGTREAFAALDDDGRFVGLALAVDIDREGREVELGYITAPAARGRGVATGMLDELTRWAFDELGALRDHADHRRREPGVVARRRALRVRPRGRDALVVPQGRRARRRRALVAPADRSVGPAHRTARARSNRSSHATDLQPALARAVHGAWPGSGDLGRSVAAATAEHSAAERRPCSAARCSQLAAQRHASRADDV